MSSVRIGTISIVSFALGLSLLVTTAAGGAATATPEVSAPTPTPDVTQQASAGIPNDVEEGTGLPPANGCIGWLLGDRRPGYDGQVGT